MDALTLLEDDDVMCITVGDSRGVTIPEGVNVQQLGRLSDDRIVSLAYSAADIFVCPSHQDNLPNTVLESIASGTPCVAFDVGGMPDMIKEGETGWLAERLDSQSLSAAIDRGLKDLSHRGSEIERSCSERAQQHYDLAVQPVKYAELYENMITQFKS
jgi:glycosyltransferase involved in cell wall biosynthesis